MSPATTLCNGVGSCTGIYEPTLALLVIVVTTAAILGIVRYMLHTGVSQL